MRMRGVLVKGEPQGSPFFVRVQREYCATGHAGQSFRLACLLGKKPRV